MEMLKGSFNQKEYEDLMLEINKLRARSFIGELSQEEEKILKDLEESLKHKMY